LAGVNAEQALDVVRFIRDLVEAVPDRLVTIALAESPRNRCRLSVHLSSRLSRRFPA
jgi:hypothetical protein